MDFISIRKFKFYTKEAIKILNICLIAFGFILAIILMKYKPMYEVKISGEEVGYIQNKNSFSEVVKENINNYKNKNVEKVELKTNPEYELKLVEKTKENEEDKIVVALQKELEITYKYYEVKYNEETIEKVNTLEEAEQIVNEVKEKSKDKIILTSNENTTNNIEEIEIDNIDVAKDNINN